MGADQKHACLFAASSLVSFDAGHHDLPKAIRGAIRLQMGKQTIIQLRLKPADGNWITERGAYDA